MDGFVTRSTRRQAAVQQSFVSSDIEPYHASSSRQLARAREESSCPPSSQESTASTSFSSSLQPAITHEYPKNPYANHGLDFDIDWSNISTKGTRYNPDRIGYRVKNKRQLRGKAVISPIYKYGADLQYLNSDNKFIRLFLCRDCHLQRSQDDAKLVDGTAHITRHLLVAHRIDTSKGLLPDTMPSLPTNPWTATLQAAGTQRTMSHTPWQEKELLDAFVDWVIFQDQTFLQATSASTRGLLTWNRFDLIASLPASPTTLSKYIQDKLVERKAEISTLLQTAPGKICISLDVWTSPNHLSFVGIAAHFVDYNLIQRDILVAFRNLYGDHTGKNQAFVVAAVLNDYGIASKLGSFVGDNATNNDSKFIDQLNLSLGIKLGTENRIRCAGHIINLVVKATIYGDGVSKFEEDLAAAAPKAQFELFRTKGVVGKIHNFVTAVLASHKRREQFLSVQKEMGEDDPFWSFGTLQLLKDGGVRWHSTYRMLLRCFELKEAIGRFQRKWKTANYASVEADDELPYDPVIDGLNEDEWDEVERLTNFLVHFYEMTKRLEGNTSVSGFGSLWQTITNLQYLDTMFREMKEATKNEDEASFFASAVRFGAEKLTTYWELILIKPTVSFYAVATILHPSLRLGWFKDKWRHHPTYYQKAEKSMKTIFNRYQEQENASFDIFDEPIQRRSTATTKHQDRFSSILDIDLSIMTGDRGHKRIKRSNELELYYEALYEDLTKTSAFIDDPMAWWHQRGKKEYPTLYKIALDFLSIPSTSCECERAFSGGRRTVTFDRGSLHGTTIEALQLQKNWIKTKVVKSELQSLIDYLTKLPQPVEVVSLDD